MFVNFPRQARPRRPAIFDRPPQRKRSSAGLQMESCKTPMQGLIRRRKTLANTQRASRRLIIWRRRCQPTSSTTTMLPFISPIAAYSSLASLLRVSFVLSNPALFLLLVTRPVWNSETILGEYGSTRSTLYKFQKCPRGGPIFGVFQDNCSLFKRGMHLCGNVPFLATAHRRRNGKGHGDNSRLCGS